MNDLFRIDHNNRFWHAELPNDCPICHEKVDIQQPRQKNITNGKCEVLFLCPNKSCKCFFLAYYKLKDGSVDTEFERFEPTTIKSEPFPESVHKISPNFVSIYAEAQKANTIGLSQIAGPGYRKAVEFLIKDYAKHLVVGEPDKDKKFRDIEESFAGNVVEKFIKEPRVQALAKRALWLGNDETHYLRKWKNQDIQDLITLIKLTIHWIDMEHLSKGYEDIMK